MLRDLAGNPAFRGFFAPASLKLAGRQAYTQRSPAPFRGFFAPASLKPIIVLNVHICIVPFRGFFAPASLKRWWYQTSPQIHQPFRGFFAPASLKQVIQVVLGHTVHSFPGLLCPGLIEASESQMAGPPRLLPFRGFFAPASLKHSESCRHSWEPGTFRGFFAPASLKPY